MKSNFMEGLKPGEGIVLVRDPEHGLVIERTMTAEEVRQEEVEFLKKFTPDFRLRALEGLSSPKSSEPK